MSEVKNLKSISTKTLGYSAKEIRKLVEDKGGQTVFLARLGGIVAEYFTGEGKHGEWVGFKGNFAVVTKDNEKFTSKVAYLPNNIAAKLKAQLEQGVIEIEVKADIFVVETEKNASGYAYMCEPVMSMESEEKMVKLTNSVFSQKLPTSLQLVAPKKQADKKQADKKTA